MNYCPRRINLLLSIFSIILAGFGCASQQARTSATWLAATANNVKAKTATYKEQRDSLAKARLMSINALEESAVVLEGMTHSTKAFWTVVNATNSPQKNLYEKILAETDGAEKHRNSLAELRREHNRKVAEAKSSVGSVEEKIAETAKLLAKLGEKSGAKNQLAFHVKFFSEVNSSLKKLQEEAKKQAKDAADSTESKQAAAKAEVNNVTLRDKK